jgi:hypothetical protein
MAERSTNVLQLLACQLSRNQSTGFISNIVFLSSIPPLFDVFRVHLKDVNLCHKEASSYVNNQSYIKSKALYHCASAVGHLSRNQSTGFISNIFFCLLFPHPLFLLFWEFV